MIKRRIFCLLLAVVLLTGLAGFTVSATEITNPGNSLECIGLDAQYSFLGNTALINNAESVILYEANSDILMYAWNADARIYPASLVKIMTALLAVEQGKLTDVVVVKENVLASVPSSAISVDLKVDELLTMEDLLYCMMVASANDAAAVIADHISGDIGAFVSAMNERATQIGCTDTVFTNVHGLHDDDQYSTARDMAKILAVASKNEAFMNIFSAISYDVAATNKSEERFLSSGNYIMNKEDVQIYYDSRVTGGRTGTDKNGLRCLATTATANGLNYIAVVTGSKSVYEKDGYTVRSFGSYNETKSLLDLGFNGNSHGQVFFKGQSLKQLPVLNGENDVVLAASSDVFAIVPQNAPLSYRYNNNSEIRAPIEQGEVLSTVEVWCNGMCIAQTDLYAMHSVSVAGTSYTTIDNSQQWFEVLIKVIVIILIVAGIGFAGFVVYSRSNAKKVRNQRTPRKKEH